MYDFVSTVKYYTYVPYNTAVFATTRTSLKHTDHDARDGKKVGHDGLETRGEKRGILRKTKPVLGISAYCMQYQGN